MEWCFRVDEEACVGIQSLHNGGVGNPEATGTWVRIFKACIQVIWGLLWLGWGDGKGGMASQRLASAAGPSGWPKRPLHRSEVRQMGHNSINKTAGRVDITSSVMYRISRARVGAVDV